MPALKSMANQLKLLNSGRPWPSPFGSRLRRAPIPLSCGIVLDLAVPGTHTKCGV